MAERAQLTFKNTFGVSDNHLRIIVWGGAALILLLPLAAMQFTGEVAWTGADFAVFGVMLALAGGALELGARLSPGLFYRLAFGLAVGAGFIMVWANLAVGVIGSGGNIANLAYLGLPVLILIGAVAVRGRPFGMALVMLAAAFAPAAISLFAVFVLDVGEGEPALLFAAKLILINGFFFGLFALSALLFWVAGRAADRPGTT